jgi:hypothetical protein
VTDSETPSQEHGVELTPREYHERELSGGSLSVDTNSLQNSATMIPKLNTLDQTISIMLLQGVQPEQVERAYPLDKQAQYETYRYRQQIESEMLHGTQSEPGMAEMVSKAATQLMNKYGDPAVAIDLTHAVAVGVPEVLRALACKGIEDALRESLGDAGVSASSPDMELHVLNALRNLDANRQPFLKTFAASRAGEDALETDLPLGRHVVTEYTRERYMARN